MEYNEVISTLDSMRSRYDDGFSAIDRNFLDQLHFLLFGKNITNKGCGNCYRDAYVIIYTHLKKVKTMPQPSLYKLKPGVVIQFFGNSTVYTNSNLTDEVAEKFLGLNPNNKALFADLPANWDERVATRLTNSNSEEESKADPDVLSKLSAQLVATESKLKETEEKLAEANEKNEALVKENVDLKLASGDNGDSDNSDKDQELENLKLELQTLQGENDSLKEEMAALKNENRALKSANTRLKNNGGTDASEPIA